VTQSPSVPPALELQGVSKQFGSLHVARDVDFTLAVGERCALIGPNGAGKTTLVNLVAGRLQPTSGAIRIGGRDVTRLSEAQRVKAGLGRTFQVTSLFRRLTVEENLALAVAEHRGLAGLLRPNRAARQAIDAAVAEIVSALRLGDAARTAVEVLPYGIQRMVELGLALALEPTVLLLDEPAAGVPRADVGIVFDAIGRLPAAMAVLLIEHDIDVVFRFAARVAVMVGGALLVQGTPKDIAAHPEVRALYLGEHTHA